VVKQKSSSVWDYVNKYKAIFLLELKLALVLLTVIEMIKC
jgi:hypothetical protein